MGSSFFLSGPSSNLNYTRLPNIPFLTPRNSSHLPTGTCREYSLCYVVERNFILGYCLHLRPGNFPTVSSARSRLLTGRTRMSSSLLTLRPARTPSTPNTWRCNGGLLGAVRALMIGRRITRGKSKGKHTRCERRYPGQHAVDF